MWSAVRGLPSRPENKSSLRLEGTLTNPSAARIADEHDARGITKEERVASEKARLDKCMLLSATSAAKMPKFPLSLEVIVRYIVATATVHSVAVAVLDTLGTNSISSQKYNSPNPISIPFDLAPNATIRFQNPTFPAFILLEYAHVSVSQVEYGH